MEITRKIADYVVSTQIEDFPPDGIQAATLTVTNLDDSGPGSLRQAIAEKTRHCYGVSPDSDSEITVRPSWPTSTAPSICPRVFPIFIAPNVCVSYLRSI